MGIAAGVDIGGTKCLGVTVDDDGTVVEVVRVATPRGDTAMLDAICEVVDQLGPFDTLGIGAAGLVTLDGVLRAAPNLPGVRELAVRAELEKRLERRVVVDNDATCATVAEWRVGAGVGCSDMVLVTLGTGIGGGYVAGGVLQRGANGFAGEPGHMVVDPKGPTCVCGQRGCWERYASGAGLARLAVEAGWPQGHDVLDGARDGDPIARGVVEEFARWTAMGVVNLTNLLDPEIIVIGGGLIEAADVLMDPIRAHFNSLLYAPEQRPHPRVVPAGLGERAGAIGAAILGRDETGTATSAVQ